LDGFTLSIRRQLSNRRQRLDLLEYAGIDATEPIARFQRLLRLQDCQLGDVFVVLGLTLFAIRPLRVCPETS
jgi:hypothetical protein